MTEFTAANLKARCEKIFDVGKPTSRFLSVTGEPYVVIGWQIDVPSAPGVVDEGKAFGWAFDEETAYFQALNCFEDYAYGKVGKLYWRIEPQFEINPETKYRCIFYMRCLISDKPEIIQTVEAMRA